MTPKNPNGSNIHAGEKLGYPELSGFLKRAFRNRLIAVCEGILNLQVKLANGYAKVTMTAQGCLIDLTRVQAGSSNTRGLPVVYMGEWTTAGNPYFAGEIVVITLGLNAGTYVSLIDDNADTPYDSTNWKKLPAAPQTSAWM